MTLRASAGGGDKPHVLISSTGDVAHCLNAGGMGRQDYETETMVAHSLRGEGFDASEDGTGRGTPIVPVAFNPQAGGDQTSLGYDLDSGTAGTLGTTQTPAVAWSIMPQNSGKDYKARQVEVAQPLMAGGPVGGNQGGDFIQQAWAVRRLTPTECERLQGFPDGYTAIPRTKGKIAADGPRYKALGNSMAINSMRWIGERIAMVDAIDAEREAAA